MAKNETDTKVSVTDKGKVADKRRATIEIEANPDLFSLSDTLAKEGAVRTLKAVLETAVRDAVAEYIGSGRKLLREATAGKKSKAEARGRKAGQDKRVAIQTP